MSLSNEELVAKLIKGSSEIDRMKAEIKLVVGMICGLVPRERLRDAGIIGVSATTISSAWGDWSVSRHGTEVVAMFHAARAGCKTSFGFSSGHNDGEMPLHNVLSVYRSLPTFVSEMVKTFLREEDIRPFLAAAK